MIAPVVSDVVALKIDPLPVPAALSQMIELPIGDATDGGGAFPNELMKFTSGEVIVAGDTTPLPGIAPVIMGVETCELGLTA